MLILVVLANAISFFRSPNLESEELPLIQAQLSDKTFFSSTAHKGRPLLIHFWATWCPTCKLEAGNIQRISQDYEVLTIAVRSGDDDKINGYLKEHDLDFRVINDDHGNLASQFSVPAYPTTFIYDKEGKLRFSEVGYTSTWGLYLRMWWAGH